MLRGATQARLETDVTVDRRCPVRPGIVEYRLAARVYRDNKGIGAIANEGEIDVTVPRHMGNDGTAQRRKSLKYDDTPWSKGNDSFTRPCDNSRRGVGLLKNIGSKAVHEFSIQVGITTSAVRLRTGGKPAPTERRAGAPPRRSRRLRSGPPLRSCGL